MGFKVHCKYSVFWLNFLIQKLTYCRFEEGEIWEYVWQNIEKSNFPQPSNWEVWEDEFGWISKK